jgi:hypothetical protein
MEELGLDAAEVCSWFRREGETRYDLVRVDTEQAGAWGKTLGIAVRRCYMSDALLKARAAELGVAATQLIAATLPDPGATMAGDFGEILVFLYQAATEHPAKAIGPKKWRLKQDRTKPAPHSDVVLFVLPSWPTPTANDVVLCAEVKTKATAGHSTPIRSAIEHCAKDRTSRLARTLVWLRERALTEDLGTVQLAHLDRFINSTEHPTAKKRFSAVAVVCSTIVDNELADVPMALPDCSLVVVVVPDLKQTYTKIFRGAANAVTP